MSEYNHEHDGIREYDNPAPAWWQLTFYATIVFAPLYAIYYHVFDGPSLKQTLDQDVARAVAAQKLHAATDDTSDELIRGEAAGAERIVQAGVVYKTNCASCHGQNLEGGIGPNLTDHFWLNGDGSPMAIYKVIYDGNGAKGMPPWKGVVNRKDMQSLAALILSKLDSHPTGAKAAQGEEYP